jgi:hypothetical protein
VFIRTESLSVKGRDPNCVYAIMHNINKNINIVACRPTMKNE